MQQRWDCNVHSLESGHAPFIRCRKQLATTLIHAVAVPQIRGQAFEHAAFCSILPPFKREKSEEVESSAIILLPLPAFGGEGRGEGAKAE